MSHIYTPYQPQESRNTQKPKYPLIKNPTSQFSYPLQARQINSTFYASKKSEGYKIYHLQFSSLGGNGQPNNVVRAVYYQSLLPGRHRLLVVLPVWGGSPFPSKIITEFIYRHSKGYINVIRVQGRYPLLDIKDLEQAPTSQQFCQLLKTLAVRIRNTVVDMKRLVDWAAHQKNISPHRISIIGFSRSTVIAGLVTRTDRNIANSIYVMGGSDPADMIYNCDYYDLKKNNARRFNWSNGKLLSVLQDYLSPTFNTLRYPARLDPRHILIFDAHHDTCISKKSREAFWIGMGKPERISFLYSHKMSFGSMTLAGLYFMPRRIVKFINLNGVVSEKRDKPMIGMNKK